jgi:hypothetical protein
MRQDPMPDPLHVAGTLFNQVQAFPHLAMRLGPGEHTELVLDIPEQPRLAFAMHLTLQNGDELHLNAGAPWLEWFPCTDQEQAERFLEAVLGLLSGRFRIRELRRGGRPTSAALQRAHAGQMGR